MATVLGGGYLASGVGGKDRMPVPHLPAGLKLDPLEGAGEVAVPDFGEESYGLSGRSPADGSALMVFLWREANLILVLSGSGPVGRDAMLGAARLMGGRTG